MIPTLMVPEPPAGDQGLVLAVNGVSVEPCSHRWLLLTVQGVTFRLPADLWPWARDLKEQSARRECMMPAVFAFRRTRGTVAVEQLSMRSIGA